MYSRRDPLQGRDAPASPTDPAALWPERQLSAAKMSEAAFLHIARSGLIRT